MPKGRRDYGAAFGTEAPPKTGRFNACYGTGYRRSVPGNLALNPFQSGL